MFQNRLVFENVLAFGRGRVARSSRASGPAPAPAARHLKTVLWERYLKVESTEVHNWGGINLIYPPSHLDQSGGSGTVRDVSGGICVVNDAFGSISDDPVHGGYLPSDLDVKIVSPGCPKPPDLI